MDQLDVYAEFKANVSRKPDERYEVNVPWIPGSQLSETNETQSRQRLLRMERKLEQNVHLREEYEKITVNQMESGIIEKVRDPPTVLYASQASGQGSCGRHKGQNDV